MWVIYSLPGQVSHQPFRKPVLSADFRAPANVRPPQVSKGPSLRDQLGLSVSGGYSRPVPAAGGHCCVVMSIVGSSIMREEGRPCRGHTLLHDMCFVMVIRAIIGVTDDSCKHIMAFLLFAVPVVFHYMNILAFYPSEDSFDLYVAAVYRRRSSPASRPSSRYRWLFLFGAGSCLFGRGTAPAGTRPLSDSVPLDDGWWRHQQTSSQSAEREGERERERERERE